MLILNTDSTPESHNYIYVIIGIIYHWLGTFITIPGLAMIAQILSIFVLTMTIINFIINWYGKYKKFKSKEEDD